LILATAGHHTTSSSIAGGVWAPSERPDEFAKLLSDRGLIRGLVEEAVRWTTPVQHFMRTAARDTEMHGRRIATGDWLMLRYLSGSRDEAVFDSPDRFRLDRRTGAAVSFGQGVHICLGQHLARLAMRIFFEGMLARRRHGACRRAKALRIGLCWGPDLCPRALQDLHTVIDAGHQGKLDDAGGISGSA
jgi:cytochrome P450